MRSIKVIAFCLALMTSQCDCDPIAEEMKCIKDKPADICNLIISYPDVDLGNLECDYKVPTEDGDKLNAEPRIEVVDPKGQFPMPVLIVMFDPDVPTTEVGEGFVHWVAKGMMDEEGEITDVTPLEELKYTAPAPPSGLAHRYQVFVFHVDADKNIEANPNPNFIRLDYLCGFMERNGLSAPIAASQFQYQSSQ